jgi:hypothetical protein
VYIEQHEYPLLSSNLYNEKTYERKGVASSGKQHFEKRSSCYECGNFTENKRNWKGS